MAGRIAHPPDAALVEGFRWAFYAAAAPAVLGALTALIRARVSGAGQPRAEDLDGP